MLFTRSGAISKRMQGMPNSHFTQSILGFFHAHSLCNWFHHGQIGTGFSDEFLAQSNQTLKEKEVTVQPRDYLFDDVTFVLNCYTHSESVNMLTVSLMFVSSTLGRS